MTVLRPTSYPGVSLRGFEGNDSEVLYNIFIESRVDLVAAVADWNEMQKESFLRGQFQTQQDQYRSRFPLARFDTIMTDDRVIGNMYVAPDDNELLLVDINLLPEYRNRGIGRALLQDLLDESVRSNKFVGLSVSQENPAIKLYERMGFITVVEQGVYRRMEWRSAAAQNDYREN